MEHYGGVHVQQNPCLEPLEATDIVLRVLSERTENKFHDTVFGFAIVPIFASVHYDYALRSAPEVEKRTSVQNSSVDEQRISEVHQPAEPERIRPPD